MQRAVRKRGDAMTKAAVLIPAYNPGMDLARLAEGLAAEGVTRVVIVGGENAAPPVFEALRAIDGCHVLHAGDMSRDRVLKQGFAYIREHFPDASGVVTVESGRGFGAADVVLVVRAIEAGSDGILLGRPGGGKGTETAAGRIVRFSFGLLAGIRVADPFAGLRGYPASVLRWLHQTRREHEACEPGVLLSAARDGIPVTEIALESSVQTETSRVSVLSFLRVYLLLVLFASSSLVSYLVDIGLYALLIGTVFESAADPILYSTVVARVFSSLLNFALNKRVVFRDMRSDYTVLVRYIVLTLLRMLASYAGVFALTAALFIDSRIVKIGVDLVLFFVGFRVQQSWVFSQPAKR